MTPRLELITTTAAELFVSLYVLHRPTDFGLRPSWAAGVRSRLPVESRLALEHAMAFLPVPLTFLHSSLPVARTASDAINALRSIPPEDRLMRLWTGYETPQEVVAAIQSIAARGKATAAEVDILRAAVARRKLPNSLQALHNLVDAACDPQKFGNEFVNALLDFQNVFFNEEEIRVAEFIVAPIRQAEEVAGRKTVGEVLADLTSGVSFTLPDEVTTIQLIPSFWATPLTFFGRVDAHTMMVLFGCRPAGMPLVPGDEVPAGLVNGLKALADPTRLRILRYLSASPLTPADLSRKLRLRAPTVVHHLAQLRLAGMVTIEIEPDGERRYALRLAGIDVVRAQIDAFIDQPTDRDV